MVALGVTAALYPTASQSAAAKTALHNSTTLYHQPLALSVVAAAGCGGRSHAGIGVERIHNPDYLPDRFPSQALPEAKRRCALEHY